MAYPAVPAGYGFQARNEIGGLPYAGSTRMVPIANGYSQNLFFGDIVILSGGTLVKNTYDPTSSPTAGIAGTIGVFVGCEYVQPGTNQTQRAQYWPSGTATNGAVGYVIDDPRVVFKAAVGSQGTSLANASSGMGYISPSFVGTNMYPIYVAGSTVSGDSATVITGGAVSNSTGNVRITAGAPFRVVGVVPETTVVITGTASTSGSSTTVTLTAANSAITAGMQLIAPTGTGSLAGNYITVTNVNGTTLTVSSAITLSAGTAVTFVGYTEALVTWNQGFHSYTNASGV